MFFYLLVVLLFGGVVAAIVSTADSVLLSFSSVVSRDLYGRRVNQRATEEQQVLVGKIVGGLVVGALLAIAWNPPGTLYSIFVLKFELIVQLAPPSSSVSAGVGGPPGRCPGACSRVLR